MTEEQKDILIAKMIDAPSTLSDEEVELIQHETELAEIYEMSAVVSGACIAQPEIDMEKEWERFCPQLRQRPASYRWVFRFAAIFAGLVFISALMVMIVDRLFADGGQTMVASLEKPSVGGMEFRVEATPPDPETPVVAEAARRKPATVRRRRNVKARVSERNPITPQDEREVEEYLRLQQARIDNDLALLCAEIFEEEYKSMLMFLDEAKLEEGAMSYAIKKVTME